MERRIFLKNTALVSGGIIVSTSLIAQPLSIRKPKKVTILHTNDTHSNIDPFPANHAKYPNRGGVARRFELIQKIRGEEENVVLLDAGDIFQGTPYFNKYGGVLEMKLMTELGYDAATMGNHDFDGGLNGFVAAQKFANFPFLCANYDFKNTEVDGQTQASTILNRGGIKIGIFGVGIELEGLVPDSKFGETRYIDPIDIANQQAINLKEKGRTPCMPEFSTARMAWPRSATISTKPARFFRRRRRSAGTPTAFSRGSITAAAKASTRS